MLEESDIKEGINQDAVDEPIIQDNVKCEDEVIDPLLANDNHLEPKCEPEEDVFTLCDSQENIESYVLPTSKHKSDKLENEADPPSDPLYIKPEDESNENEGCIVECSSPDILNVQVVNDNRKLQRMNIRSNEFRTLPKRYDAGDVTNTRMVENEHNTTHGVTIHNNKEADNHQHTQKDSNNSVTDPIINIRKLRSKSSKHQKKFENTPKNKNTNKSSTTIFNSNNENIKSFSKPTRKNYLHKCKTCTYSGSSVLDLNRHMFSNHKDLPLIPVVFKCNDCPYYATTNESLKVHVLTKHDNALHSLLGGTGAGSSHNSDVERFMRYCSTEPLHCLHCKFSSKYKDTLESHLKKHKTSTSLISVERDGDKPIFKCNKCGQTHKVRNSILCHVRTHTGEKPYCCSFCGKCFSNSRNMNEHIANHVQENQLVCDICNYTTTSKRFLSSHMTNHSDVKLKCPECSYETTRKSSYELHMRKHTGEKPFKCKNCPFQGVSEASVYHHSKRHSEKGLLKCLHCNYTTYHKYNFETHIKRHTGDGLMVCASCNHSTSHRANFVLHVTKGCPKAKIRL